MRRPSDEGRLAQALYWLGRLQYVLRNAAAAIEYAGQSLEIADRLGDETLAAPPVNLTGAIDMFRQMGMAWDLDRAEEALRES